MSVCPVTLAPKLADRFRVTTYRSSAIPKRSLSRAGGKYAPLQHCELERIGVLKFILYNSHAHANQRRPPASASGRYDAGAVV